MAENSRMKAAEKTAKTFGLLWNWGRRVAFLGVFLAIVFAFFWGIMGIYLQWLIIVANVFIFSGMAVAYAGFSRLKSLLKELASVPGGSGLCPLCGKVNPQNTLICASCGQVLENQLHPYRAP
jgi:hypothetical protein